MVGDDGNRVGGSLNILTPFGKGKNDCKEFSVIDIIIMFGGEEGTREISAGMKVTVGIILQKDDTRSK